MAWEPRGNITGPAGDVPDDLKPIYVDPAAGSLDGKPPGLIVRTS